MTTLISHEDTLHFCSGNTPEVVARQMVRDQERIQELEAALERTLGNFKLVLAQKPIRDAAETIAEAEAALRV